MNELENLISFDIERSMSPKRLVAAGLIAMSFALIALQLMQSQMAISTKDIAGTATVLDPFYLAMNNVYCSSLLLPVGCGILCADLFVRDVPGDMRCLIATNLRKPRHYWQANALAALILCSWFVLSAFAITLLLAAVALGLPLGDSTVPVWLATEGPEYTVWSSFGPIPQTWNYWATILGIVTGASALQTALMLAIMALTARAQRPTLPLIVCLAIFFVLSSLGDLLASIGLLLGKTEMTTTIGWPADRLCLQNYRFGADFFQTQAGSLAVFADDSSSAAGSMVFPINSWAGLVLIFLVLTIASLIFLAWTFRKPGTITATRESSYSREVHHDKQF